MVSCKPIKEKVKTNWVTLVKGLREMIANLHKDIDLRDERIKEQDEEIEKCHTEIEQLKKQGTSSESTPSKKYSRKHVRQRSQLPQDIHSEHNIVATVLGLEKAELLRRQSTINTNARVPSVT